MNKLYKIGLLNLFIFPLLLTSCGEYKGKKIDREEVNELVNSYQKIDSFDTFSLTYENKIISSERELYFTAKYIFDKNNNYLYYEHFYPYILGVEGVLKYDTIAHRVFECYLVNENDYQLYSLIELLLEDYPNVETIYNISSSEANEQFIAAQEYLISSLYFDKSYLNLFGATYYNRYNELVIESEEYYENTIVMPYLNFNGKFSGTTLMYFNQNGYIKELRVKGDIESFLDDEGYFTGSLSLVLKASYNEKVDTSIKHPDITNKI